MTNTQRPTSEIASKIILSLMREGHLKINSPWQGVNAQDCAQKVLDAERENPAQVSEEEIYEKGKAWILSNLGVHAPIDVFKAAYRAAMADNATASFPSEEEFVAWFKKEIGLEYLKWSPVHKSYIWLKARLFGEK